MARPCPSLVLALIQYVTICKKFEYEVLRVAYRRQNECPNRNDERLASFPYIWFQQIIHLLLARDCLTNCMICSYRDTNRYWNISYLNLMTNRQLNRAIRIWTFSNRLYRNSASSIHTQHTHYWIPTSKVWQVLILGVLLKYEQRFPGVKNIGHKPWNK